MCGNWNVQIPNYGATLSINSKKVNINPKQKNYIHFYIFGIKKRKEIECNWTNTYLIENTQNHAWLKSFQIDWFKQ